MFFFIIALFLVNTKGKNIAFFEFRLQNNQTDCIIPCKPLAGKSDIP